MIDIEIQISIPERSSGWAINYVGHCSWETFDNCGCHGWMIERVTQTEIVTIDDGCFCGAGLDLKRKNFLSWQCRSPTCRRRNVVQYLLTMLHILEMMKNAKIMLMRIQKLAKRFWWRNLSHKNADILFLPDAEVFTTRMPTCYSLREAPPPKKTGKCGNFSQVGDPPPSPPVWEPHVCEKN